MRHKKRLPNVAERFGDDIFTVIFVCFDDVTLIAYQSHVERNRGSVDYVLGTGCPLTNSEKNTPMV